VKRYKKAFWITLFVKQNNHHEYSVLVHTLKVTYHLIRHKKYNMILAGLLHDIAKPLSAHQDEKDKLTGEYSFTNHEAMGYYIIKNWPISERTKILVRYHYLLRGMHLAKKRNQIGKYNRQKRHWDRLDEVTQKDLAKFLECDDLGKDKGWL
jgi:HD superfamily phosphohydrolase